MVNFIQAEATEKAEEIRVQAEEEFTREKEKLVDDGKSRIRDIYEKKEAQVKIERKISQSNEEKAARLSVLKLRNDTMIEILEETSERLKEFSKNKQQYKELLEELILQSALQLSETDISVVGREEDKNVLESVVSSVEKRYTKKTEKSIKISIAKDNFLKNSIGGVFVIGLRGRIQIDNTLEERLRLSLEQMVPLLRHELFPHGENLY